jgi:hypothetical protein
MLLAAVILAQAVPPINIAPAPPPIQTYPTIPPPAPPVLRKPTRQVQATAPTDQGETFAFAEAGNWLIRVDLTLSAGCYAYAQFEDGTFIRIMSDPARKRVLFGLANWRWRSLDPEMSYHLEIQLGENEPWSGDASVLDLGAKMLVLDVDADFLAELAQSWTLRARYDEKRLATLDLTASEKALSELLRCERAVAERINDPFAN